MKKLLSFLLVVVMISTLIPLKTFATDDGESVSVSDDNSGSSDGGSDDDSDDSNDSGSDDDSHNSYDDDSDDSLDGDSDDSSGSDSDDSADSDSDDSFDNDSSGDSDDDSDSTLNESVDKEIEPEEEDSKGSEIAEVTIRLEGDIEDFSGITVKFSSAESGLEKKSVENDGTVVFDVPDEGNRFDVSISGLSNKFEVAEGVWTLNGGTYTRKFNRDTLESLGGVVDVAVASIEATEREETEEPQVSEPVEPLELEPIVPQALPVFEPVVAETPEMPEELEAATVTFVVDNTEFQVEVELGKTCSPPQKPEIPDGMVSFLGWYLEGAEVPFDFSSLITGDITLYARFSNTYLIKYKSGSGGEDKVIFTRTLTLNAPILPLPAEELSNIVPPDNSFISYWYDEDAGEETPFVFTSARATKDISLVPFFSSQHYVFFISDGTQVPLQMVNHGEIVQSPTPPTRAGYTFKHWATEESGETAFDFSTPITEDTMLYAVWTPQTVEYTLVYWLEKPNFSGDPGTNPDNYAFYRTETKQTLAGAAVTFPEDGNGLTAIDYAGYSHAVSPVILGNGTSVVNVYFKRLVYTFTFDLNPGKNDDNNRNGATMSFSGKTYSQGVNSSGYTLNGGQYSFMAKYEQDIENLWPSSWNAKIVKTSRKKTNNLWGSATTTAFAEWTPSGVTTTSGLVSKRFTITKDIVPKNGASATFKAKWANVITHQVNYWPEQLVCESGGEEKTFNEVSRWYLKSDYHSQNIDLSNGLTAKTIEGMTHIGSDNKTTDTTTEYNFYYSRNRWTLSFNTVGGTAIDSKSNVMFEEKLSASYCKPTDPTRDSFTFTGWYYDAEYRIPFSFDDEPRMPNSNLTLFAKWESTDHEVTYYDGVDGEQVYKQGVASGGYAKPDDAPYYIGKSVEGKGEFDGWYWKVGSRLVKFSFDMPVRENIELYAQWKTSGFKVTYMIGEGSGTVPTDSHIYELGTQSRVLSGSNLTGDDGATFFGWKEDGKDFVYYPGNYFEINGNVTLVAQYASGSELVKVTYHSDMPGGSSDSEVWRARKDSTITLAGKIFDSDSPGTVLIGWSNNSGDNNTLDYELGTTGHMVGQTDVNLYGVWKFEGYTVNFYTEGNGTLNGTTTFTKISSGASWNNAVTVPAPVPVNDSYNFIGWDKAFPDEITQNENFIAKFALKTTLKVKANSGEFTYDGTPKTISGFTSEGLMSGHTLAVSSVDVAETNVGSYPIALGEVTVTDENGIDVTSRYTVNKQDGELVINPRPATVKAENKSKLAGTQGPELTATLSGFLEGDEPAYTLGRKVGETVGNYPITLTNRIGSPNYAITWIEANFEIKSNSNLKLGIIAKSLTEVYNGTEWAIGTNAYTTTELPEGFGVTAVTSGASSTNVTAGITNKVLNYTITFNGLPVDGVTVLPVNGKLIVTPKPATVTAESKSKLAGTDDPELTVLLDGFIGGYTPSYKIGRLAGEEIGDYPIILTDLGGNLNYDIEWINAALEIQRNPNYQITITARSRTEVYNGTEWAIETDEYTTTGVPEGFEVTAVTSGASSTDVTDGIPNKLESYNVTFNGSPVDGVTVLPVDGTLVVTPKPATVTAENKSKLAGTQDPELTAALNGFIGGYKPSYSIGRAAGEAIGNYPVTLSGHDTNQNYDIKWENAALNIQENQGFEITITANSLTKVYNGTEWTLGTDDYTTTELPNGFAVTAVTSGAASTNATDGLTNKVIDYTVTYNGLPVNGVTVIPVDGKLVVTPKPATITAESKNKVYGSTDPVLTVVAAGAVNGDGINYTLSRYPGEDVGEYPIVVTLGDNPNYSVDVVNSTLTVTPSDDTSGGSTPNGGTSGGGTTGGGTNGSSRSGGNSSIRGSSGRGLYAGDSSNDGSSAGAATITINDGEVPLAQPPTGLDDIIIILDDQVPLGNLPRTGGTSSKIPAGLLTLLAGLAGALKLLTNKDEE